MHSYFRYFTSFELFIPKKLEFDKSNYKVCISANITQLMGLDIDSRLTIASQLKYLLLFRNAFRCKMQMF